MSERKFLHIPEATADGRSGSPLIVPEGVKTIPLAPSKVILRRITKPSDLRLFDAIKPQICFK